MLRDGREGRPTQLESAAGELAAVRLARWGSVRAARRPTEPAIGKQSSSGLVVQVCEPLSKDA